MRHRLWIALCLLALCIVAAIQLGRPRPEDLVYQGKTIRTWALQLEAPDQKTRDLAASSLKAMGTNAVPGLLRLLRSRESLPRKEATKVAAGLPRSLRRWTLSRIGYSEAASTRALSARALGLIEPPAGEAIPALAEALRDKEQSVRLDAATALGHMGAPAVPSLIKALGDKNPDVRHAAAYALGQTGTAARAALPELIGVLGDTNEYVRSSASGTLASLGLEALPALTNALGSRLPLARQTAAKTITRIHPPLRAVAVPLAGLLRDEDSDCRAQALATLAEFPALDSETLAAVLSALKDPVAEVRLAAVGCLASSQSRKEAVIGALTVCLRDEFAPVRENAARALGDIGAPARGAIPELNRLTSDSSRLVRVAAKEALARLEAN